MAKQKENGLLIHKYSLLSAAFQQLYHPNDSEEHKINKKIEELFLEEKTWEKSNQIELLLTSLMVGDELDQVLSKNLFKAEKLGTDITEYYQAQISSANSDQTKQVILKQLVQDLQSEDIRMRLRHTYSSNAWYLASYAFIVTFILFFLPYFFPPVLKYLYHLGEGGGRAIDIFTAVTSGAMGAAFSMLTGLKRRISKSSLSGLQLLQRKSYVLSKIITGFGAGLIFFYFLQSGLLSGVAFPEYSNDTVSLSENVNFDMKSLALLVIWCFLSGFSEKLVPTILSKTERQLKQGAGDQDEAN